VINNDNGLASDQIPEVYYSSIVVIFTDLPTGKKFAEYFLIYLEFS